MLKANEIECCEKIKQNIELECKKFNEHLENSILNIVKIIEKFENSTKI